MEPTQETQPDSTAKASLRVLSLLTERLGLAQLAGQTFSGDRKLFEVLGYTLNPSYEQFLAMYRTTHIAKRIVKAYPAATWRHFPKVTDDQDAKTDTPFELAWKSIEKRLKVAAKLERADKLASLGRFGVIVIGTRGTDVSAPLARVKSPDDVVYLAPYGEGAVQIDEAIKNPADPRFGMPEFYKITVQSPINGLSSQTLKVHHTRCIHVAEDLLDNEVYGEPLLAPVYNLLQDIIKTIGGAAEMFWRNGMGMLSVEQDADTDLLSDADKQALQDQFTELWNNLRRTIQTRGIQLKSLAQQVSDPTGLVDVIMQFISSATGIPKRILTGSERGELASGQDQDNWAERVMERQETWAGPMVLEVLIDRLIEIGALPEPAKGDYRVDWPDQLAAGSREKAEIAEIRSRALAHYAPNGPDLIVPPEEYREEFLELPPEPPGGFVREGQPPVIVHNAEAMGFYEAGLTA